MVKKKKAYAKKYGTFLDIEKTQNSNHCGKFEKKNKLNLELFSDSIYHQSDLG